MKPIVYSLFFVLFSIVLLQSFDQVESGKRKKDGTDPGYTGSPGDGKKNCTFCHGGVADFATGWITSDIPSDGFKPGQIYTITATNTYAGSNRFGFEVSPQDIAGNLLGEMIITDTTNTKLVGNDKYITYKAPGVDGIDSRSWTFNWKAPSDTNVTKVVFYGAFNSNHDGMKANDRTVLSNLTVKREGAVVGLNPIGKLAQIQLYPNPVSDFINFAYANPDLEDVQLELFRSDGTSVKTIYSGNESLIHQQTDIRDLSSGIYFVKMQIGSNSQIRKISVF